MLNFQLWNTSVRSHFIDGCIAPSWENLKQGALQIQLTLLSGISNFPIKLHKDAHRLLSPLPHVASEAIADGQCIWRQGLQALLVGIYFWKHTPATYIFSVPLA